MKNYAVLLVWVVLTATCVLGIAGITSWGCFSKHRLAWLLLGCSSVPAICIILSISFSFVPRHPLRQSALFLLATLSVSSMIVAGVLLSASLPRFGPPRRADLLQLATLVPLVVLSLSFTPCLLRIHRGIQLARVHQITNASKLIELFTFGLLIAFAFLIPIAADSYIGHSSSIFGFVVLASVTCIAFGSVVLFPAVAVVMQLRRTVQLLLATALFVVAWTVAVFIIDSMFGPFGTQETIATASAATSGLFVMIVYLVSLNLRGYRLRVPARTIAPARNSGVTIHPLDAVG